MKQYWIEHLVSWIVGTYIGLLHSVIGGFRDPVSFTNVLVDLVHVAELAVVLLTASSEVGTGRYPNGQDHRQEQDSHGGPFLRKYCAQCQSLS
ncbi:MAG: hypothetical protein PHP75_04790 [Methylacidiphilaceae bacterium]|nr:hypothetical protein [Candidatus Methylacidiphilaceae bacterium]